MFWIDLFGVLLEPRFSLGFGKTLPLQFSFGGAISTLARQGGGSIQDLQLSFICGLISVWRCRFVGFSGGDRDIFQVFGLILCVFSDVLQLP
jgi:hypothetical protein